MMPGPIEYESEDLRIARVATSRSATASVT